CPPAKEGTTRQCRGGVVWADRNPPPRRCAPPLLDEEGRVLELALLVEEGRTRQCRGRVVPWPQIPTTPSLRATPPRRGGEWVLTLPSCEGGHDATMARRGGLRRSKPHHPDAWQLYACSLRRRDAAHPTSPSPASMSA